MLNEISQSIFLGPSVAHAVSLSFNEQLTHYKKNLSSIQSYLTGSLLDNNEGHLVMGPSHSFLKVQEAISSFLSLFFNNSLEPLDFIDHIPPGTHLYWDGDLIDNALDIVNKFNLFLAQELLSYPVRLQEKFRLLATDQVRNNVNSLIAQAQTFEDSYNYNFLKEYASEENMKKMIANIHAIIPSFITLLESLEAADMDLSLIHI